ncbi:TonB family protein [Psychromonas sp.]|nr:TonB family protein [Psychromonas sp.]
MTTATYQQLALNWHPQSKTDKPFVFLVTFMLLLFMGLAIIMGSITVPKETKREKVVIPERVAKFILDKPKVIEKQPPKPKVIEKPIPKPIPKPIEIKQEAPKPKDKITVKKEPPKKRAPLTEKQAKARETASQSGLLALSSELTDLMDTSSIDSMVGTKIAKSNGSTANTSSSNKGADVLTASATKRSEGVKSSDVLLAKGKSNVTLDQAQGDAGQAALLASRADDDKVTGKQTAKATGTEKTERTGNYRPEEDIALVMDQNKSKLHALYRKARRSNPAIQGKIVLEITISPEGKVLKVVIASSELNDKKLEARIVSRVKSFNFGVANVKPVTVTYPIEFLPS